MILRISEEELSVEATVDRSKRREDGESYVGRDTAAEPGMICSTRRRK